MFNPYVGVVTSTNYSYGCAASADSWLRIKGTREYKNIYKTNTAYNYERARVRILNPGVKYEGSDSYVTHSAYNFSWAGRISSINS